MAAARGAGRVKNQRPEIREEKERMKSRMPKARSSWEVFFLSSLDAFLKLRAGIFRAKFGLSSGRQAGKDILSKAHPDAGRAKRAFSAQTMGLFEKKERAKEKERKRAEEKQSRGGRKRAFLAALFSGNEEKSRAIEAQRAQREGSPKNERASTIGMKRMGRGRFFLSPSFFPWAFRGPAVRLP
ncbi:MAG: hypothetical protein II818_00190 [Aeriscardovia sp.]|nr:hypothetical protein [Aeriscardovia sp.]